MTKTRFVALLLAAGLLLQSCGDDAASDGDARPLVVATTTILGDLVANVVGEEARLEVLMPIGADPHEFQASSSQIAALHRADLVVANGLGLEEGMGDLLEAASADGVRVFPVGPQLDPISLSSGREAFDPHVWLDPARMAEAARLIAAELSEIHAGGDWMLRAEEYAGELLATDEEVSDRLSTVLEEDRLLVTNHDTLGYFATRYDFEVVGVVIPGGSTLADPSSAHLADLVDVMRREGVRVIFGETTEPDVLAAAVVSELGENVEVVELFTESLAEPGSGAETLIDLLKTNAVRISEALAPGR